MSFLEGSVRDHSRPLLRSRFLVLSFLGIFGAGKVLHAMDGDPKADLIAAACAGDPQLVQRLLAAEAAPDLGPLLIQATSCLGFRPGGRHTEVLRLLLERGADVEVCDSAGRRPLHFVAMRADVEQLRLLLAKGADPNPPESNTGNPPLLWASGVGSVESVSLLLDHGADVNLRNPADCATALHRAAANGHLAVVRKLIEKGADPNLTDLQGKASLGRALQNGHADVAEFLRATGARENGEPSASCRPPEGLAVKSCRPAEPPVRDEPPEQVLSSQEVQSRVRQLVSRWERETGTLLSPEIHLEAQAQIAQLLGTGCWPGADEALRSRCRQVLGRDDGLYPPLQAFLNEALIQAAARPLPLFRRAADAIEPDLAAALGWPPTGALNRYRCADLPDPLRGATVSVLEQGEVRTVEPPVKRVCMLPGSITLVARDTSTGAARLLHADASLDASARLTEITSPATLKVSEILPDLGWFCPDPPSGETSPIARSQGRDAALPSREQQAPFRNAAVGRVKLLDPGSACSEECREALVQEIVEAIQLWRSGCSDCAGATLQGLDIDGRIYVARPLIDRLLLTSSRRADAFLTKAPRELEPEPPPEGDGADGEPEAFLNLGSFAVSGGFGYVSVAAAPYQLVEPSSPLAQQLCGKLAGTSSDAGRALRWLLCSARDLAVDCPACVGVDLALAERITLGCSDGPDTLACAAADRGIELNLRDFRFEGLSVGRLTPRGLEPSPISLGKGPEAAELFPVLVHELGHWFGLPHLDDPRTTTAGRVNVMVPVAHVDGHCITAGNLRMLNHAVSQAWSFRLLSCGGFQRPPAPSKAPR